MEEYFEEKIPYKKQPISVNTQIAKLRKRGLIIEDTGIAEDYLSNISYYRLRAYTFPFQNNTDKEADHAFLRNDIMFSDIIDLYCFDRRLRSLIFNAIEKIEVSIRTNIIQTYCDATNNSHWFYQEELFKDASHMVNEEEKFLYNELMDDIYREVGRSNEDFLKHYRQKYSTPNDPPAWMTLEVISFGTLSRLYELLKKDDNKKAIAKRYGFNKIEFLENWLHALANLRNCCAHHGRVWNRRYVVNILLPKVTDFPFIDRNSLSAIRSNKIFAYLCCIKYMLDIISPGNNFYKNLKIIIKNGGKLLSLKEMGFTENWKCLDLWKE